MRNVSDIEVKPVILMILMLVSPFGCDEYLGGVVDCSECLEYEPDSAYLIVDLTINDQHQAVPLVFYNGRIEDDSIEWVDTAYSSPFYLNVAIDRYYSVRAEYFIGNKRIVAVDGDRILAKHVSESCEYECWIITRGTLDVRLKYEDFK